MKLLADLAGCDNGEVTLHVRRQERGQVENFIQVWHTPELLFGKLIYSVEVTIEYSVQPK